MVRILLFLLLCASLLGAGVLVGCGGSSSDPPAAKPGLTLTANPTSIAAGQSAQLTWASLGATSLTSSTFGAKDINGSVAVSPTQTTTYTITVTGPGGSTTAQATVTVLPAPTITLTANPTTITAGQSTTLTWSSTGATSLTSSNFGAKDINGTVAVTPAQTTTYTITVQGAGGSTTGQATVTVNPSSGGVGITVN